MGKYFEVEKNNLEVLLDEYRILCCKIKTSRIKSKQLAILEMIMLTYDLNVSFIKNGPLGDVQGIISFFVKKSDWDEVIVKLKYLGYCNNFFELTFDRSPSVNETEIVTVNKLNWKGHDYSLYKLFEQDEKIYEKQSPHNRKFKIVSSDGSIKTIEGYRGDGSELGRRALPVEDARCMVNLSIPFRNTRAIDPYAGGGGIIYMYKYINPAVDVSSIDIDTVLNPGLEFYGSTHYVGNSATLKINDTFDALVTEVPFSLGAVNNVKATLSNMNNFLDDNAVIVLMCGLDQSGEISEYLGSKLESYLIFGKELNRKGTDVVIQVWTKDENLSKDLDSFTKTLRKIY